MIRTRLILLVLAALFTAGATFAQESDQDFNRELNQESPQQAKAEAEKPDTKASAGDLAKAVQNPVASLISAPVQNLTDFYIGPFQEFATQSFSSNLSSPCNSVRVGTSSRGLSLLSSISPTSCSLIRAPSVSETSIPPSPCLPPIQES
jgi:hypothetical protein